MSDVVNPITNLYRTHLKREPDAEGFMFWTNEFERLRNVNGESGALALIEQEFKNSVEYKKLHG